MVRRYLVEHEAWSADLSQRLRDLALELLALTDEHETHPVLYYAHPRRVQHSFLRILVTVQALIGLLRYGLSPDRYPTIVRNPQLLLLEQSLHYSLRRLSASFAVPPTSSSLEQHERTALRREFDAICDAMENLGLISSRIVATQPVPVLVDTDLSPAPGSQEALPITRGDDAIVYGGTPVVLDPALDLASDSSLTSYITFRQETDPHIAAYAAASGYPVEAARGDYETTWWIGGR